MSQIESLHHLHISQYHWLNTAQKHVLFNYYIQMGISNEQFRVSVGFFNRNKYCRKPAPKVLCYNDIHFNKKSATGSSTNKNEQTFSDQIKYSSIIMFLAIFSIIFLITMGMLVDLSKNQQSVLASITKTSFNNINYYQTYMINWIFVIIALYPNVHFLNLIHLSTLSTENSKSSNIIKSMYLVMFKFKKMTFMTKIATVYGLFVFCLNLSLIIITNPSIVNPGPVTNFLSVAYCNAQGFILMSSIGGRQPIFQTHKLLDFQSFLHSSKPDVVAINESWLNEYINFNEIVNENFYKCYRFDRDQLDKDKYGKKGGGGIFILVRQDIDIETKLVSIENKHKIPVLSIEIKFRDSSKICFSTFYRYGYSKVDTFEAAESYYQEICRKYKKVIMIGDINLSTIDDWTDPSSSCELENKYINLFNELGLTCVVNTPTHKLGNILDLLFTNQPGLIKDLKIEPDLVCPSDHFSISFKIRKNVPRKRPSKKKVFRYKEADWTSICLDLQSYNWESLFYRKSIIDAWNIFKSKIDIAMRKYIPFKAIKFRPQPPWFDDELFQLSKSKHRLRKIFKASGLPTDEENFKKSKIRLKQKENEKKREFLIADPCNDTHDQQNNENQIKKTFWSFLKSSSKSSRIPDVIHYKGRYRSNKMDQCDLFNKFFCDQFSDASSYDIPINIQNDRTGIGFSSYDIYEFLKKVKVKKAPGPDAISGHVLKNCASVLSSPLAMLFNISYQTGELPDDWKSAYVVPIHKSDKKDDIENYRPVSLTSLVMKIFEKCLRTILYEKCKDKITIMQHGFLPERSCTTQMLNYIDFLAVQLNNKSQTDVIYFDFSKAFDSVNHDIILKKLKEQYNIDGYLLRFLKEYLRNRKQATVIEGEISAFSKVQSGVPQGSILGPLLFILFINDIVDLVDNNTHILLYADDIKIFRELKNENDHAILQSDIDCLELWAQCNKMKFNTDKCKVFKCSLMRDPANDERQYTMGSVILELAVDEKDLGVIMVPNLKWNKQHSKLLSKASQKLGLLRRNCSFSNNNIHRKNLYLAIVRSQFEHCSQIWRPVCTTQSEKFEALQKKSVKWICNEDFSYFSRTQYFDKLKELDILPLALKFDLNDLVFFHKTFYFPTAFRQLPNYLLQMKSFDPKSVLTTRAMKKYDNLQFLCTIFPRIDIFKNSFYYRVHNLWNTVPYEVREVSNPSEFKNKLKEYLWTIAKATIFRN